MTDLHFIAKTKSLIDSLKSVCANYGLGNDGNEFKIITQVFLYKFLNDKFAYEAKKLPEYGLAEAENFQVALEAIPEEDYKLFLILLHPDAPRLQPHHTTTFLFNKQNEDDFAKLFDDTLRQISLANAEIYSVKSASGAKDKMFDELSQFISDPSQRDAFCKALISKLFEFSFEGMFGEKYDFFATIFEYLIKDYNSDSGGKYAEYYTPHAVARIMAAILVNEEGVRGVRVYDPSAGSGTLLMNIAHAIGEENCSIYSEDISQKSSSMLRLNLVLNNLSHSIPHIIKGNTLLEPSYRAEKFDYIVSNPPFKLDFSDFRADLDKDINKSRFFAGIPKVPKKDKKKMPIYLLFIQHIMFSLSDIGKAAVVVPTGFSTEQKGIAYTIRKQLVEKGWLRGVVSMPSNIFASTGTNVSVLFMDRQADNEHIVLIDASNLGETVKDDNKERTVLTETEERRIITAMNDKMPDEDFAAIVKADDIRSKNYSFSAGQYFDIKINHISLTQEEFKEKMQVHSEKISSLFAESQRLEKEIQKQLGGLVYA